MSGLQSETSEDLIDMDEHRLVVEAGFDLFFVQILSDIFILAKIFVEIFALKPVESGIAIFAKGIHVVAEKIGRIIRIALV